MTTKSRSHDRFRLGTNRPAAVSASVVLHSVLLAAAAILPAGAIANERSADAPEFPAHFAARLTWAPRSDAPDAVVVTAPRAEAPRVPRLSAERVVAAEVEAEDAALAADRCADEPVASEPRAAPSAPTFAQARRLHDLVSLRPGRGGAGAEQGDGPGQNPGAGGGIGVGGSGGPGGAAVAGDGTAEFGTGRGAGTDGTGTGWNGRVAGSGATCGPSIVGELPSPLYPSKARARGWEGRVVLVLAIDAHGRVTSAEVAETSGRSALDDAARDAAPAWTFAPALCDGVPVAGSLRVPVRFALTD